MALVAYSDSEGSDGEKEQTLVHKPPTATTTTTTSQSTTTSNTNNFSIDRTNPGKIRVNLQSLAQSSANGDDRDDTERATKRPRLGPGQRGGVLSDFNAMLPAPKRDTEKPLQTQSGGSKAPARKVFSLKTGAEPGFSRESDAELKDFFAEQDRLIRSNTPNHGSANDYEEEIPVVSKVKDHSTSTMNMPVKSNTFMFKPLSVSRNNKKSTKPVSITADNVDAVRRAPKGPTPSEGVRLNPPKPEKVDLFSFGSAQELPPDVSEPTKFMPHDTADDDFDYSETSADVMDVAPAPSVFYNESQSLDTIANDLGLSAAERRQLLGRNGKAGEKAMNIVNFNTDDEYAANEAFRASGEQVQHNPVRAIAPGKHSLKQLVSAASGQRDALEESFASGRRNRKEAGNKYGW